MRWTIKLTHNAAKSIKTLDRLSRDRIRNFLRQELTALDNPRVKGKPLAGKLHGLWRYRVGDYRLICEIQNEKLVVLVIKIGHRRDVYS